MHLLSTSIEYLKGVGPKRAELLKKELEIFTFRDLLFHFPFRYIDKSKIYLVADLKTETPSIQLFGKIIKIEEKGHKKNKRLIAYFQDKSGTVELVWFKGLRWIKSSIKLNSNYLVFGKPSFFNGTYNIVHPEIDLKQENDNFFSGGFQAVYPSTELLNARGLSSRAISKLIKTLLPLIEDDFVETLSQDILSKFNLPSRIEAFFDIHAPKNTKKLVRAQKRLKFEELFFFQLHLLKTKANRQQKINGYSFNILGDNFNNFYQNYLPFDLTNAQKRVLKDIRKDLKSSKQMNRLLQGDVGSGKTLVALLSMLIAVDNSYQACIMAPTEILSQQHFEYFSEFLKDLNINIALLTGSTKTRSRKKIHEQLENGSINLLIGTHALLEDKVKFSNLGLVIIDEQHRFGVAQRARLWRKNNRPPHVLVMTATPIPRTLSMTLYGDLDVSVIDELPPGRKLVKTTWKSDSSRLQIINFIKRQISEGRQIYIVFPLIDESDTFDYKNLVEGINSIEREFPLPDYQISVLHGQMKAEDKEYEMKRFVEGVTNIMVSTTVIEVGVNVPNASVMIIESAERFGLSQLHQLRGRVGRGAEQSYCILMSGNKLSHEAKARLSTMVETNDGFKIAEEDLKLRGPGDMMGTQQSGMLNFKIVDIVKDNKILIFARKEAENLLQNDQSLEKVENINIARAYFPYAKERLGWSRIS